jgi:hypothetical protein
LITKIFGPKTQEHKTSGEKCLLRVTVRTVSCMFGTIQGRLAIVGRN